MASLLTILLFCNELFDEFADLISDDFWSETIVGDDITSRSGFTKAVNTDDVLGILV